MDVASHYALVGALGRYTSAAELAEATANMVVADHTLAHLSAGHTRAYGSDYTAGLVPWHDLRPRPAFSGRLVQEGQVSAANPGGAHGKKYLAWPRRWVGQVNQVDHSITR
jgi:hypothetical protein